MQDGALLLGGLGNMNDLVAEGNRTIGMALRFFSPQTRLWSIYWVSHSDGLMQPPVVGAFAETAQAASRAATTMKADLCACVLPGPASRPSARAGSRPFPKTAAATGKPTG